MSNEAEVRIRTRISTSELERRWKAVRQAMKESGLDFLVFQNCTDVLGGYVKWFTDMSAAHNYPATVIFPRDDEMTTIWHGPNPPAEPGPPSWAFRGVKRRISVPVLPSLAFTTTFDAGKVVEELAPYKDCHVGLVGMGFIPASFYKYITEHLSTARFEDATDLVDNIKAIKSDEEIRHLRELAALQDITFEYALTCIKPGKRDRDVYADVLHKCLELGGEQANLMVGSTPVGTAARHTPLHFGNRMIQEGDQVLILIESNGPSGFYTELGRIICLGKVPSELEEVFALAQKAQKVTLDILKPGADPQTIWDANNEFMRSIGYPEETRIYAHGMGYDMVERPSIMPGETMKIQARMNIAVHPSVGNARVLGNVCENYLVAEKGANECLHKTAQKIFVL